MNKLVSWYDGNVSTDTAIQVINETANTGPELGPLIAAMWAAFVVGCVLFFLFFGLPLYKWAVSETKLGEWSKALAEEVNWNIAEDFPSFILFVLLAKLATFLITFILAYIVYYAEEIYNKAIVVLSWLISEQLALFTIVSATIAITFVLPLLLRAILRVQRKQYQVYNALLYHELNTDKEES